TIKALYYAAIINGIVAIPLIGIILKLANTEAIVGKFKTPRIHLLIGRITFVFMIAAVLLMFLDFFGVVW
ncbi:MAG: divalent metal cation transporter, partial [bacterium]|nr:divalent metal cation transporter [bacterium]